MKADDGLYNDVCEVVISVLNVDDNAPVFLPFNKNISIEEEKLYDECLTTVRAFALIFHKCNFIWSISHGVNIFTGESMGSGHRRPE